MTSVKVAYESIYMLCKKAAKINGSRASDKGPPLGHIMKLFTSELLTVTRQIRIKTVMHVILTIKPCSHACSS
jgi:hypothetical protein